MISTIDRLMQQKQQYKGGLRKCEPGVALDRFTSGDVCLARCCQGVLASNHAVYRGLVARACADMCLGSLA